jgi:hypothetical protein
VKKEYVLRIIVCDEDDAAELLTEFYDDIDTEIESMAFEVDGDEVIIPSKIMKHFAKLESDILGLS